MPDTRERCKVGIGQNWEAWVVLVRLELDSGQWHEVGLTPDDARAVAGTLVRLADELELGIRRERCVRN